MDPGHGHYCKDGVLDYQECQIVLIFGSLSPDFPANGNIGTCRCACPILFTKVLCFSISSCQHLLSLSFSQSSSFPPYTTIFNPSGTLSNSFFLSSFEFSAVSGVLWDQPRQGLPGSQPARHQLRDRNVCTHEERSPWQCGRLQELWPLLGRGLFLRAVHPGKLGLGNCQLNRFNCPAPFSAFNRPPNSFLGVGRRRDSL